MSTTKVDNPIEQILRNNHEQYNILKPNDANNMHDPELCTEHFTGPLMLSMNPFESV